MELVGNRKKKVLPIVDSFLVFKKMEKKVQVYKLKDGFLLDSLSFFLLFFLFALVQLKKMNKKIKIPSVYKQNASEQSNKLS